MPSPGEKHLGLRKGRLGQYPVGGFLEQQFQVEGPGSEPPEGSFARNIVDVALDAPDVSLDEQEGILFLEGRLDSPVGGGRFEDFRVVLLDALLQADAYHGRSPEMVEEGYVGKPVLVFCHESFAGNQGREFLEHPENPPRCLPGGRRPVEVCLQRFLKELVIEENGTVSPGGGEGDMPVRERSDREEGRHGTFAPALKVYLVENVAESDVFVPVFCPLNVFPLRRRQVVGMGHHCRNRQQAPVGTVFKPDRGIGVCMVVPGGEGEGLPPVSPFLKPVGSHVHVVFPFSRSPLDKLSHVMKQSSHGGKPDPFP